MDGEMRQLSCCSRTVHTINHTGGLGFLLLFGSIVSFWGVYYSGANTCAPLLKCSVYLALPTMLWEIALGVLLRTKLKVCCVAAS